MKYDIKNDGNLHVNYSSLVRCGTSKGASRVVAERHGIAPRFSNKETDLGIKRHERWQNESMETGYTPDDFKHIYRAKVAYVEQDFSVEIFKGVLIHFRPDSVSIDDCAVIDYKKVVDPAAKFLNDWQLKVYAYLLQLHGIRIKKLVHLCEMWNREGTAIVGYQHLIREVNLADLALVPQWLKERSLRVKQAEEAYKKVAL